MSRERGNSEEIFLRPEPKAGYVRGDIENELHKQLKQIEEKDL